MIERIIVICLPWIAPGLISLMPQFSSEKIRNGTLKTIELSSMIGISKLSQIIWRCSNFIKNDSKDGILVKLFQFFSTTCVKVWTDDWWSHWRIRSAVSSPENPIPPRTIFNIPNFKGGKLSAQLFFIFISSSWMKSSSKGGKWLQSAFSTLEERKMLNSCNLTTPLNKKVRSKYFILQSLIERNLILPFDELNKSWWISFAVLVDRKLLDAIKLSDKVLLFS